MPDDARHRPTASLEQDFMRRRRERDHALTRVRLHTRHAQAGTRQVNVLAVQPAEFRNPHAGQLQRRNESGPRDVVRAAFASRVQTSRRRIFPISTSDTRYLREHPGHALDGWPLPAD